MRNVFIIMSVLLLSMQCLAGDAEGLIEKIKIFPKDYNGTYNSNSEVVLAVFYMADLGKACNSEERRIGIASDHPLYQSALSLAMMAKASGTAVKVVYPGTCSLRDNMWDLGVMEVLSGPN